MYLNKKFEIVRNDGEVTIQAYVQIQGDGEKFLINLREKGTSSMSCKFVLDESEIHSFASMFNELSDDAISGYPEQYEPTIEE